MRSRTLYSQAHAQASVSLRPLHHAAEMDYNARLRTLHRAFSPSALQLCPQRRYAVHVILLEQRHHRVFVREYSGCCIRFYPARVLLFDHHKTTKVHDANAKTS